MAAKCTSDCTLEGDSLRVRRKRRCYPAALFCTVLGVTLQVLTEKGPSTCWASAGMSYA